MDYMKLIPGAEKEYIFESSDIGEITAVITACKVSNVRHKLFKKDDGSEWRVVYFVKPKIQNKVEEVVRVYRDVRKKIA